MPYPSARDFLNNRTLSSRKWVWVWCGKRKLLK